MGDVTTAEKIIYALPTSVDSMKIEEDMYSVPYDEQGNLLSEEKRKDKKNMTMLDMRIGSTYKVTQGPYSGDMGEVIGKNLQGHYRLVTKHKVGSKGLLETLGELSWPMVDRGSRYGDCAHFTHPYNCK